MIQLENSLTRTPWPALVAWTSVWLLVTTCLAQQPDPAGWSHTPESESQVKTTFVAELVANRPGSIATRTEVPDNPSADIRNQIGLATYEAPQASQSIPAAARTANPEVASPLSLMFSSQTEQLTSPEGLTSSIKVALLLATLSLAPAIILMTTCYVRVIVVLTLLKQAFGAQQLPPTQVLTALSLFVTLLIMTPVWNQVKTEAIDPYTQSENGISWDEAWARGIIPVKTFMANQIEAAGNGESVALFYKYLPDHSMNPPSSAGDVPINVLLPAFMVSELKVAFLLGFQIFLPFLVLDLVVSSVTVSTGMLMLPPTMVSFPLKLILFVLVDGWNLVVGMLLQSFAPFT